MPDLDLRIREWREEMKRAGITQPDALNELETHLREQAAVLIRSGVTEETAFQTAVAQLGSPDSIRREFGKVSGAAAATAIAKAGWIVALVAIVAVMAARMSSDVMNPLLRAHVLCLTAGYITVFIAGALGIFHVWQRLFDTSTEARDESLSDAVFSFHRLAAGLVGAGLLFGMAWSKQSWSRYFSADLREIGTWSVMLWLCAVIIVQRRSQWSRHAVLLLPILGNLVLIMAWFGAGIAGSGLKNYGPADHWPFELLAALHLLVFVLGLLPVHSARLKNS